VQPLHRRHPLPSQPVHFTLTRLLMGLELGPLPQKVQLAILAIGDWVWWWGEWLLVAGSSLNFEG
jgi:hypothetical protein